MNIRRWSSPLILGFFLCVLTVLGSACENSAIGSNNVGSVAGSSGTVNVVATENFYGDVVKQIGGSHVAVTSILSNPDIDPHEYQSNVQTGISVSKAGLVIENGGGYDVWMDQILSSVPNRSRLLIKAFDLATTKLPSNEHVWYDFGNMTVIAQAIAGDLKKLDPADAAIFERNLQTFKLSMQTLEQKINAVKVKYNGTKVGLTETIDLYQTNPEGLQVLTPFEFEKAIAEGNDPPADTLVTATTQITQHQIKVLIYNEQTVTPVTTNLENLAHAQHIPIVPVTETMPPGKTYQTWMMDQLNTLLTALAAS